MALLLLHFCVYCLPWHLWETLWEMLVINALEEEDWVLRLAHNVFCEFYGFCIYCMFVPSLYCIKTPVWWVRSMLGHSFVFSSFQVGKQFDALLIDTTAPTPPVFDVFPDQDTLDVSKIHQLDLSSLSKKKQKNSSIAGFVLREISSASVGSRLRGI